MSNHTLWQKIERELPFVQSPSQYIGCEFNSVAKEHSTVAVKCVFAFPDTYKIGMSHLGLQIFYGMLNSRPDVLCERTFSPWPDMEERMRKNNIPLFSLETHTPVRDFDIVGFSIQSEMSYTNILNMLDLAGIPFLSAERNNDYPVIVGGGPCAFYPEPIADFFDLFIIGDGEEAMTAIVDVYKELKSRRADKRTMLIEFARRVPGAYVPSLYTISYNTDGTIASIVPSDGAPAIIRKAVVLSLEETYYPLKPIVPFPEIVHDRINLEIMRGCPHRCRFCQAVNIKNKLRFRPVEQLVSFAEETYKNTGLDEIALTSLSSGDYPHISEIMARLNARFRQRGVNVSLPSLRIDEKLPELPPLMKSVRKSGFTLAPEAGTERLRVTIHKPIKDVDLFETARVAFREGWRHIKLYFMVGLPSETDEDIDGIIETAKKVSAVGKEAMGFYADVNVTISPFIPKPHTPFQWHAMASLERITDIENRLKNLARGTRIHLKMHDPKQSFVETVFARGDRRLSKALLIAHKNGLKFDEWGEYFNYNGWLEVSKDAAIDPYFYAYRQRQTDEILPWEMLDTGIPKWFLMKELDYSEQSGKKGAETLVT